MVREDLRSATYASVSARISCCIWALIKWPVGLKQVTEKERHVSKKKKKTPYMTLDTTVADGGKTATNFVVFVQIYLL